MMQKTGDLEDQNRELAERLAALKKMSKKMIRPKKDFYLNPVKKNDIVKIKNNYKEVGSKMDYETMRDHNINKEKRNNKRKIAKEMSACTFKPRLNKTSKKMTKGFGYIKPQDKKLLRKEKPKKKEDDFDSAEMEATTFDNIMKEFDKEGEETGPVVKKKPKKVKKINQNFYDKQLKWLNKNKQMAEKQRLENAMKEYSEVTNVPKTNRKKNKKMLGTRKKFIDRVEDQTMKLKLKKEEHDEKYDRGNFVPKINRNYNVQSKVNTYNKNGGDRTDRTVEDPEYEEGGYFEGKDDHDYYEEQDNDEHYPEDDYSKQ